MNQTRGIYARYIKRFLDIICCLATLVVFGWLYILVAIAVRVKLGSPVIFCQERPGKDGKIFKMYKFRSMSDERGEDGEFLPDEARLGEFGTRLRGSSLDEIPEVFNILKGDMSIIGPRPQLVRDMVFMTSEQKKRHCVRPGLTGLAQVNGRNAIDWENKLNFDLEYIQKVTFWGDIKILLRTVWAFIKKDGITEENHVTATDYGDYLLERGKVSKEEYDKKQREAKEILRSLKQGE